MWGADLGEETIILIIKTTFTVRYGIRLMKQLSIEHIIRNSTAVEAMWLQTDR